MEVLQFVLENLRGPRLAQISRGDENVFTGTINSAVSH